jgi:hypothetical protein
MSGCLLPTWPARKMRLKDLMSPASYDRDGDDLVARGLYLDLPPWGYHLVRDDPSVTNAFGSAEFEATSSPRWYVRTRFETTRSPPATWWLSMSSP